MGKDLQVLARRAKFKYFDVHDKVEVKYKKSKDKFMKAVLIRDRGDDTYDVRYDDEKASVETCVPVSHIRSLMNKLESNEDDEQDYTDNDYYSDDDDESIDKAAL